MTVEKLPIDGKRETFVSSLITVKQIAFQTIMASAVGGFYFLFFSYWLIFLGLPVCIILLAGAGNDAVDLVGLLDKTHAD